MTSKERAVHRLNQIDGRLTAKHPRAAKDGELLSMLEDLRDIVQHELNEPDEQTARKWHDEFCGCEFAAEHLARIAGQAS